MRKRMVRYYIRRFKQRVMCIAASFSFIFFLLFTRITPQKYFCTIKSKAYAKKGVALLYVGEYMQWLELLEVTRRAGLTLAWAKLF